MRRFLRPCSGVTPLTAAVMVAAVVALSAGAASAQTTTGPVTTTTRPATPTTTGASSTTQATTPGSTGAGTGTTAPGTATTLAPITTESSDSGSDIPWVPIAIGAAILLAIVIGLIIWSRARGAATQKAADWRAGAADATAEAGATARMLSGGSPATAAVAQQMLASLRAFEDLEESAPDSAARSSAQQGRRVIQNLGRAIDADYSLRRTQPPATPDRVEGSAAMLRSTAAETDRALRALYRGFTETS